MTGQPIVELETQQLHAGTPPIKALHDAVAEIERHFVEAETSARTAESCRVRALRELWELRARIEAGEAGEGVKVVLVRHQFRAEPERRREVMLIGLAEGKQHTVRTARPP